MTRNVEKSSNSRRLLAVATMSCAAVVLAAPPPRPNPITSPLAIAGTAKAAVRAMLGAGTAPARDTGSMLYVWAQVPDPRLRLPTCAVPLQARLATERIEYGRTLVRVSCNEPAWSLFVPVRVETETDVLVVSRPLQRGSAVTAADVQLQRRRFSGVTENYVKSVDDLRRYRLRRPLTPGALLARDALEPAPVVQRGSLVTVRTETGGYRVDAAGRALADAAPGQRVRVQNIASSKVVEGLADEDGIVRLEP